ncbi:MAG: acetate/propionate family kinase [Hyphomicrobiales bacterium]
MNRAFLILNAGSSSLKFALYDAGALELLCRGGIANLGQSAKLDIGRQLASGTIDWRAPPVTGSHEDVVAWLIEVLRAAEQLEVVAAGHRIVHGGHEFEAPVLLDDATLAKLDRLTPLAPGHEPHNLAGVRAVTKAWPGLPQIGCFDTAFHRSQPRLAQLFGLPHAYAEAGMLRYGFHGLSYEYIAGVLPDIAGGRAEGRIVVAHLGNGASLCALKGRRSLATTMGYTAIDGLIMSTRCGAIDPGLVLQLVRERGCEPVADLLNNRSGLLGVSGISGDVRVLEASDDPRAKEALDLFVYRILREAGSLIAALGGLDVFVFTAGIGEHSAKLRNQICEGLAWTGARIDPLRNKTPEGRIHADGSSVELLVIPTNEERPIARAMQRLVGIR